MARDYWTCKCGANLDHGEKCEECEARADKIEIFDWVKNVVSGDVGMVRALFNIPDGENKGDYIDLELNGKIKYDSPLKNYKLIQKGEPCGRI